MFEPFIKLSLFALRLRRGIYTPGAAGGSFAWNVSAKKNKNHLRHYFFDTKLNALVFFTRCLSFLMVTIIAVFLKSHTVIQMKAFRRSNPTSKIVFNVFSADGHFRKHFAIWVPFFSYILMCSDTQRYVTPPPLFFSHFLPLFLFSFASFLVPRWFRFLSPCPACLLKQKQAHLLWWSLCLELKIDPETQENVMRKEKWMQTSGTFVALFCTFLSPEVDAF